MHHGCFCFSPGVPEAPVILSYVGLRKAVNDARRSWCS